MGFPAYLDITSGWHMWLHWNIFFPACPHSIIFSSQQYSLSFSWSEVQHTHSILLHFHHHYYSISVRHKARIFQFNTATHWTGKDNRTSQKEFNSKMFQSKNNTTSVWRKTCVEKTDYYYFALFFQSKRADQKIKQEKAGKLHKH